MGICQGNLQVIDVDMHWKVVVSHFQRIGYQPKTTLANPARCLLNREKTTKENVWRRTLLPPPPPRCSLLKLLGENK